MERRGLMRLYVNGVYRGIESGIELGCDNYQAAISVMTDEARCAYVPAISNTTLITGSYSTADSPLNDWSLEYANIRKANIFLKNAATSPVADADKQSLT